MALGLEKISCFSSKGKFFFFAYASDMDELNMQVHYPSAIKRAVACLCNHRLVFKNEWNVCKSATASFEPTAGRFVWGVVWEVDYFAACSPSRPEASILAYVEVVTIDGYTVLCGAHQAAGAGPAAASGAQLLRVTNAALRAQLPPPYILGLCAHADPVPDADPFSDSDADAESLSAGDSPPRSPRD